MSQKCLIEIQDEFDRLLSQTKALLIVLTANDNFENINKNEVANTLWLVLDRLDDLATTYSETIKRLP